MVDSHNIGQFSWTLHLINHIVQHSLLTAPSEISPCLAGDRPLLYNINDIDAGRTAPNLPERV